MDIILRLEEEKDYRCVENLTREAFWNVYKPGCDEHFLLHQMRRSPDFIPELDFVAEMHGEVVGNIAYTRAKVVSEDGAENPVICFGPLSVLPAFQGKGIGSRLIEHTCAVARTMAFKAVLIFGNPAYYQRFGFKNAQCFKISTANGKNFDAFMAKELYEGGLQGISGRFLDSEVFKVDQEQCELFDSQFPPKEKLVTDTQLKEEDFQ